MNYTRIFINYYIYKEKKIIKIIKVYSFEDNHRTNQYGIDKINLYEFNNF